MNISPGAYFSQKLSSNGPRGPRRGYDPETISESCQRVRTAMLLQRPHSPLIPLLRYVERGQLASVLRIAGLRYAIKANAQYRDKRTNPLDDIEEDVALWQASDPEIDLLDAQRSALFKACFQDAVSALEPRERTMMKLRYVEELKYREIARLFNVDVSTIGRQLARLHSKIVRAVQKMWRQHDPEGLPEQEILSCQLDLSLSRLLRSRPSSKDLDPALAQPS